MNNVINSLDTGHTAWLLMSTLLVFLVALGLELYYAGRIRKQFVIVLGLMSLQWVLFGYSLAFGPDLHGSIGNLAWAGLHYVDTAPNADYSAMVPHNTFMMYQGMIAVIPAILLLAVCGERMKFSAFCFFVLLWTTVVYDPVTHWIAGQNGFLRTGGVLDYAGGASVQMTAGVAALLAALALRRVDHPPENTVASPDFASASLGAGFLWLGWFGWVGGSSLTAGGAASNAFISVQVSAAAAGLTWAALDRWLDSRLTTQGLWTGVLSGLVAVSAVAGSVTVWGAIRIGVIAALLLYGALILLKNKFHGEDSLDVFAVHGLIGMWGVFAVGLWSVSALSHMAQLGLQIKAILAITLYTLLMTWFLLKGIALTIGVRSK